MRCDDNPVSVEELFSPYRAETYLLPTPGVAALRAATPGWDLLPLWGRAHISKGICDALH